MHNPAHPLRVRRIALGLRQTDLAKLAGVSRETVSRIETGDPPRMTTAHALASVLDEPVDRLFPPISKAA